MGLNNCECGATLHWQILGFLFEVSAAPACLWDVVFCSEMADCLCENWQPVGVGVWSCLPFLEASGKVWTYPFLWTTLFVHLNYGFPLIQTIPLSFINWNCGHFFFCWSLSFHLFDKIFPFILRWRPVLYLCNQLTTLVMLSFILDFIKKRYNIRLDY